jgi:hypothetical protein
VVQILSESNFNSIPSRNFSFGNIVPRLYLLRNGGLWAFGAPPGDAEQFIHGKLTFRAASETFNAEILLRENRDESIRTIHRKDF